MSDPHYIAKNMWKINSMITITNEIEAKYNIEWSVLRDMMNQCNDYDELEAMLTKWEEHNAQLTPAST